MKIAVHAIAAQVSVDDATASPRSAVLQAKNEWYSTLIDDGYED